jgi:hypothetical protein
MKNEQLINAAIEQIVIDVYREDYTAIAELLAHVPESILVGFLSDMKGE